MGVTKMVVVVYSTKLKIEKDHKSKIINQDRDLDQDLEKDQIKTEFQEQDQGPNKQGPR